MNKSLIIARYTFKELLKSKVMINTAWFSIGLMIFTYIISEFSFGNPRIIALDVGVGLSSLAAVSISIFLGVSLLSDEIKSRTAYITLSRPVSRKSFIMGKLLGMSSILFLNILIIMICSLGIYLFFGGSLDSLILIFLSFAFIEAFLTLLIVVFFSLITNKILAIINAIVLYILGYAVPNSLEIGMVKNSEMLTFLIKGYSYVFPDFSRFNMKSQLTLGFDYNLNLLLNSYIYSLSYCLFLILVISFIFDRKELS